MTRCWLLCVLLAGGAATCAFAADDPFTERRNALAPDDYAGLFELGMDCLSQGGALERRGRECFEDLLQAPREYRHKALYRLALWHLGRGRGYADARWGVKLLAELEAEGTDAPAGRELESRRLTLGARKRDRVERARGALVGGRVENAARDLAEARRLPFGRASGEPDLDDEALLEQIAQALADAEREARRFQDPSLPVACPACKGTGLEPCDKCDGAGKIKTKTAPRRVLTPEGFKYEKGRVVEVDCPACGGGGLKSCRSCRATGVDFDLLDPSMRNSYLKFGGWLKNLASLSDPVRAVERAFEQTLEERLRVPASLKASVPFPLIPPAREKMDVASLEAYWKRAAEKDKVGLLRGVTILSARWLEPYFFQAQARRTLGVKEPLEERPRCVPLTPEIVSAYPLAFKDGWVSLTGEIASNAVKGLWPQDVLWLQVRGEKGAHNLQMFVWKQQARENHRILAEIHRDFTSLSRFLWTYDYDLENAVSTLRPGTKLILYGRFLYDPGGFPSEALEVWSVDPVLERKEVVPARDPVPEPLEGQAPAVRAALEHNRALHALRRASGDDDEADAAGIEAIERLRNAVALYQEALAASPEDDILQESHARTLDLLYRLLRGGTWPA